MNSRKVRYTTDILKPYMFFYDDYLKILNQIAKVEDEDGCLYSYSLWRCATLQNIADGKDKSELKINNKLHKSALNYDEQCQFKDLIIKFNSDIWFKRPSHGLKSRYSMFYDIKKNQLYKCTDIDEPINWDKKIYVYLENNIIKND